jgi:hypothetical protein
MQVAEYSGQIGPPGIHVIDALQGTAQTAHRSDCYRLGSIREKEGEKRE